jgi:uncharacterized protein YigE (DUF2233 family)
MRKRFLQIGLVLLTAVAASGVARADACRDARYEHARYIVCTFDPAKDDLKLYWRGQDGRAFRTFDALASELEEQGQSLQFAMNGGMYEDDFSPVGLYVENGRRLAKINRKIVRGRPSQVPNFYKKPNGVFYFGDDGAGVLPTERYIETRPKAQFATQSGPMLVIDGKIHPAFLVKSKDFKPRNGVGVSPDGKAHFVMTRGRVSFYEFAQFFRDGLGTQNALFLDGGSAPGIYAPGLRRNDAPSHGGYGPIIAVVE